MRTVGLRFLLVLVVMLVWISGSRAGSHFPGSAPIRTNGIGHFASLSFLFLAGNPMAFLGWESSTALAAEPSLFVRLVLWSGAVGICLLRRRRQRLTHESPPSPSAGI
jgi:hypothetical protein